jgi:hypothetical protein
LLRNIGSDAWPVDRSEVTDPNARRSRAGSEVRAYRAGTRQVAIVGNRRFRQRLLLAESELPVHLGIAGELERATSDIEVITITGGNAPGEHRPRVNPATIADDREDYYDALSGAS